MWFYRWKLTMMLSALRPSTGAGFLLFIVEFQSLFKLKVGFLCVILAVLELTLYTRSTSNLKIFLPLRLQWQWLEACATTVQHILRSQERMLALRVWDYSNKYRFPILHFTFIKKMYIHFTLVSLESLYIYIYIGESLPSLKYCCGQVQIV